MQGNLYIEFIREKQYAHTYTIIPVICKEEAEEIINVLRKYENDVGYNWEIRLKENGKIIKQEEHSPCET